MLAMTTTAMRMRTRYLCEAIPATGILENTVLICASGSDTIVTAERFTRPAFRFPVGLLIAGTWMEFSGMAGSLCSLESAAHSGTFASAPSLRGGTATPERSGEGFTESSVRSGFAGTGVPQEEQNRESGARRVPQSEHDGGWATRAPQDSQNTVFAGTGFLHLGQIICFFLFMPGIHLPPGIWSLWT
jgi:hypothetical protein